MITSRVTGELPVPVPVRPRYGTDKKRREKCDRCSNCKVTD